MKPLHPVAKVVVVLAGFLLALAVAVAVFAVQEYATPADPSQGMQAFGDLLLAVTIFFVLASVPAALGLYWLWDGLFRRKPAAREQP